MRTRTLIAAALAIAPVAHAQPAAPQPQHTLEITAGLVSQNDGSFNYQGVLTDNGQPANGMYSFFIEPYSSPDGFDIAHELLFFSDPVPVVDGLFSLDIQMGADPDEARRFFREIGDEPLYLQIGVGTAKGGPYTTLDTRAKVGWSARAQYAGIAESLRFPYADTYTDPSADPTTMLALTSEFGGTVALLRSNSETDEPTVLIRGRGVYNDTFDFQSGALLVDSRDDEIAIRAEGARYSVVGHHSEPSTLPGVTAAVLGSVGFFASPDIAAVWAFNSAAGTSARLGIEHYAGDFDGDVIIRDELRVQDGVARDFAPDQPAPVGPIAYGVITAFGTISSATANLNARWDAPSSSYLISVDDNSFTGFATTQVTVIDSNEPRVATTNIRSGEIQVTIWDLNSGNIRVQDNFTVVIYDPTAGSGVERLPAIDDADAFMTRNPGFRIQTPPAPTPPPADAAPIPD